MRHWRRALPTHPVAIRNLDNAPESPEGQSVLDVTHQHGTTQKLRSSATQPDGRKRELSDRTTQWRWSAVRHPVNTKFTTAHQQGSRDRNACRPRISKRRPESTEQRNLSRQQGAGPIMWPKCVGERRCHGIKSPVFEGKLTVRPPLRTGHGTTSPVTGIKKNNPKANQSQFPKNTARHNGCA
jgi:hypothetical protein